MTEVAPGHCPLCGQPLNPPDDSPNLQGLGAGAAMLVAGPALMVWSLTSFLFALGAGFLAWAVVVYWTRQDARAEHRAKLEQLIAAKQRRQAGQRTGRWE